MLRFFIYFFIILSQVNLAFAVARIDITRGTVEPISIAINEFSGNNAETKAISDEVTKLVESNLTGSGLFKSIPQEAFIENISNPQIIPDFQTWRQIKAEIVLVGHVISQPNNKIGVEFRTWDSFNGKEVVGKSYVAHSNNWRKIAHKISDDIYMAVTGEQGYFNTKIAYIAESGSAKKRIKKIAIMDSDGYNNRILSSGKHLVLTPRISPDATKILYLSYISRKPHVHLMDVNTGHDRIIGNFPGMTYAPRFSKDGSSAIMSASTNGNSEIYTINLNNGSRSKLTSGPWIDTSPDYSPEGSKIVFASDRSGRSQLYIMNKDGSNQNRISFGDGTYNTPAWSPRGDYIAFTKLVNGNFHIGVIRPDGSGERLIARGYLVEGPTWSPNGRIIMFTRGEPNSRSSAGKSKLYTIDLTGYNEREISTDGDASDPCWSPLLK
jgi:TolB protein